MGKSFTKKIRAHIEPILNWMPVKNRQMFFVLLKQFRKIIGDDINK